MVRQMNHHEGGNIIGHRLGFVMPFGDGGIFFLKSPFVQDSGAEFGMVKIQSLLYGSGIDFFIVNLVFGQVADDLEQSQTADVVEQAHVEGFIPEFEALVRGNNFSGIGAGQGMGPEFRYDPSNRRLIRPAFRMTFRWFQPTRR